MSRTRRTRFVTGLAAVIASLIIGKVTTVTFFLYEAPLLRWGSAIIYLLTWPLMFVGIWLVGTELARLDRYARYFTLTHYSQIARPHLVRLRLRSRDILLRASAWPGEAAQSTKYIKKGALRRRGR